MQKLRISVIVPTVNRPEDLHRCLRALKEQERSADEVLVVIGPGDFIAEDMIKEIAAGDERWRWVRETQASLICSLNRGIREAKGDIVTLTDDDAEAPPEWLKLIERHFLGNARLGAIGGRDRLMLPQVPSLSNPNPARIVGDFNWCGILTGNHHCGVVHSPCEVSVLKGVNLSFRRCAFGRTIDAYLVGYGAEAGSEIDICLTIKRNGWVILYDNAVYVRHYVGQRLKGDNRIDHFSPNALRVVQNSAYLGWKYLSVWQLILLSVLGVLKGGRRQPGILVGLYYLLTGYGAGARFAVKIISASYRGARDGFVARNKKTAHDSGK